MKLECSFEFYFCCYACSSIHWYQSMFGILSFMWWMLFFSSNVLGCSFFESYVLEKFPSFFSWLKLYLLSCIYSWVCKEYCVIFRDFFGLKSCWKLRSKLASMAGWKKTVHLELEIRKFVHCVHEKWRRRWVDWTGSTEPVGLVWPILVDLAYF